MSYVKDQKKYRNLLIRAVYITKLGKFKAYFPKIGILIVRLDVDEMNSFDVYLLLGGISNHNNKITYNNHYVTRIA